MPEQIEPDGEWVLINFSRNILMGSGLPNGKEGPPIRFDSESRSLAFLKGWRIADYEPIRASDQRAQMALLATLA